MPLRSRLTLAFLATLVAALALAPGTPWLRDRAVDAVVDAAATLGYRIEHGGSTGNLWRGLALVDVTVVGPGIDLRAARLGATWFAPSLVVGELPLQIEARDARGEITWTDLAPLPTGGGGAPVVRPRVDAIRIDGGALQLAEIPFTLPDLTVDRVDATTLPDGRFRLDLAVRTPDGSVEGSVVAGWGSSEVAATIDRADATVARAWWDGVEAGTVTGDLRWTAAGADGTFALEDATVRAFGATARDVRGPIVWRGDRIEASLVGSALGGRISATGDVDLATPSWRAVGDVDVDLVAASRVLTDYLGAASVPLADVGRVTGRVALDGWTDVRVDGALAVEGSWLGAPLSVPALEIGYDADQGFELDVAGTWGEGPVSVAADPTPNGLAWSLAAGPVDVWGVPVESATADFTTGGGPLVGRAAASAAADGWAVAVDAVVDAEGLQAFATGTLLDAPFEGAVAAPTLAADAPLAGEVAWRPDPTDWSGAPTLALAVGGLLGRPSARATVTGDAAVAPRAVAPYVAGLDLRGAVDLVLADDSSLTVDGRLGPLQVSGDVGDLTATVDAPIGLGGPLTGSVGPARATWRDGALEAEGVATIAAAVDAVPGLAGAGAATDGEVPWRVRFDDAGWSLDVDGGRWQAALPPDGPWRLAVADGRLRLAGRPATLDVEGDAATGVGGIELDGGVLSADLAWSEGVLDLDLGTREESLRLAIDPAGAVSAVGRVDLAAWSDLGGEPLAGVADVDARWSPGGTPEGTLSVRLDAPVAATARVDAVGGVVTGALTADGYGVSARADGRWDLSADEGPTGQLHVGPLGPVAWSGGDAAGAGVLPPFTWAAVAVPELPWQASVGASGASLEVGGLEVRYDAGTATVVARLDQPIVWGGAPASASGEARWSPEQPAGAVSVAIDLGGGAVARAEGDAERLTGAFEGSAARWAAGIAPLLGNGDAALAGVLDGAFSWSPNAGAAGTVAWRDGEAILADGTFAWGTDGTTWSLVAEDWDARGDGRGATWSGTEARLDALLSDPPVAVTADGTLGYAAASGWSGEATGTLSVPEAGDVDVDWRATGDGGLRVVADARSGPLLGRVEVLVSLDGRFSGAWDLDAAGRASGSGTWGFDAEGAFLAGAVDVPAGGEGPVAWPAFGADVAWRPAGALEVVPRGALIGIDGRAWRLPVEVFDEVATVTGALEDGGASVAVAHPLGVAEWSGTVDAWRLVGSARPLAQLDPSVADVRVDVDLAGGGLTADGSWSAQADGAALGGGTLSVDGGSLAATLAGTSLELSSAAFWPSGWGSAGDGRLALRADADGWRVDGTIGLATGPDAVPVRAELHVDGRAADLTLATTALGEVRLRGRAADLTTALADGFDLDGRAFGQPLAGSLRPDADAWALTLAAGGDDAPSWTAAARLAAVGEGVVELRGPALGTATATWSLPERRAVLDADVGGVELTARLEPGAAGDLALAIEGRVPAADAVVALSGPLAPLDLAGTLALGGGAPTPARLTAAPTWRLAWGDLVAQWAGGALVLDGTTGADQLPAVLLSTESLAYHPTDGWSGRGRLGLSREGRIDVAAELLGNGVLDADVDVRVAGRPVGGAQVALPATLDGAWSGNVAIEAPLAALLGTSVEDAGVLSVSGSIDGFGPSPRADLALALSGRVPAHGRAVWDGREARVDLIGQGLSASGSWSEARGALAIVELQDADAAEVLPMLDAPRIDLRVDVRAVDGATSVRIDTLRLRTSASVLDGGGRLSEDGMVSLSMRLAADLADVRGVPGLAGSVTGPVSFVGPVDDLAAGALTAQLDVEGVTWGGLDARVDGEVAATGEAGDPVLRASWRAEGPDVALAGGATWRPNVGPTVELQAVGRAAGLDVDLDLRVVGSDVAGGGRVAGRGGVATLTAWNGALVAVGGDAWTGWTATIDPAEASLTLAGELDAWSNGSGKVSATARYDRTWSVTGRAEDLVLAGVEVGDVALQGDPEGGWRATGEHVAGSADVDLRAFEVHARALPLPVGDVLLEAEWVRGADGDRGAARVHGTLPTGPVDLRATLEGRPAAGSLRGEVVGEVLGGSLAWPVARTDEGWSGTGRLEGASAGSTRFDATVVLSGTGAVPDVEVGVADPGGGWRVDAEWSSGQALLAAEVRTPEGRHAVRGRAWPDLDVVIDDGRGGAARVRGGWNEAALRIEGAVDLGWGPVRVELTEPDVLRARLVGLDGGWSTTLPPRSLLDAWAGVRADGWTWTGDGAWGGELVVGRADAAPLVLSGASLRYGETTLRLDGPLDLSGGGLDWSIDAPTAPPAFAALEGRVGWDGTNVEVDADGLGTATFARDALARRTAWTIDAAVAGGRVVGDLAWTDAGWAGRIEADGLLLPIAGGATLDLEVVGAGPAVAIDAALRADRGVVTAEGVWDGAPLRIGDWGPPATGRRDFDLRANGIDLGGLGGARGLDGVVAGSVAVRGDLVVGQLAAEPLVLGGSSLPASLALQGDLGGGPQGTLRLELGASYATAELDGDGVAVFAQMAAFPLHDAVAAAFGANDVEAQVTGAVRGAWAWGASRPHDVRLATEHVRLERAGVVTTGNVALSWDGVALRIGEAAFEGRGEWRAAGSATPEAIDLELVATDADFSPLLGLVPSLARFAVTAVGDLRVRATGTLGEPDVVAEATALEVGVAGTRYRLEDVRGELAGAGWNVRAAVAGVAPLGGRVDLVAGGRIGPFPETGFTVDARAVGDLDVPVLGRVAGLEADFRWSDAEPPTIAATGGVGGPLEVSGTLAPLDVAVRGTGLALAVPFLFVADAVADVDARIVADGAGVRISGRLDASQARIDLAARQGTTATGPDAAPEPVAPADPASVQAARERVRFDAIRIVAPQRVTIAESFANADAAVDLTLDGNAAAPRLAGTVMAVRGTLRFAGRDLELTEAVATFDPARGIFPMLQVAGRTSFEKTRVVPPGLDVRFTAPPGPRFTVDVALAGEATNDGGAFALDLEPQLTSDALVEGLDGGLGARPLTDLELLTLVALGRLEVTSGFAGAVAQNALDAAVDLLVTAEIQAALAETLGIDVVELRTTPVTSLLDGGDPFGVSLRLGGYLSDEVFASYRVSTLDESGVGAFSNEVSFAYQLGPVGIDVTGRVDVAAGSTATVGPALAVAARYGFADDWSLEFGVDLSTERSLARLGVTWRW